MPQVDFYHVTQSTLDDALWTHDPESWLPHGLDDAPGADRAGIWINSVVEGNPVSVEFLFLLHGAERPDMGGFERVFNLFDGRSEAQVAQAREQWRSWKASEDLTMRYFAQDDTGRWEQRQ